MVNLDTIVIDIPCPKCNFTNPVTFQDVRTQKIIVCRGCKRNIQLVDKQTSTAKVKKIIDESISKLKKTVKKTKIKL